MLRAIFRKEFQFHVAGFPLRVGVLLTLVLAASSTLIATRDYNLRLRTYREKVAAQARALQQVTVYSFLQPVVVRPPEPLSVLAQGLDARLGSDVTIHPFAVPAEATGGFQGNDFLVASPVADLTTIVTIVLGLLALLLAHDAIQAERGGGTLPTFLAFDVPRGTLLAGKILGGLAALALPLGGALAVSLVLFVAQVEASLSFAYWLRTAGLAAGYASYLSLMFLLGLLVSLSVRSRSAAPAASVVTWLVVVLILPGANRTLAGNLWDTRAARQEAARSGAELLSTRDRHFAAELRREPLRAKFSGHSAISFASGQNLAVRYRYGSAAYYDAMAAYYRTQIALGMRYAEAVFVEQSRSRETLRTAERLASAFAMVSPAALLDSLSEGIAGTSIEDYDHFLSACRSYRQALVRYLEAKGAFGSWRWFTDDSRGQLHPWPRFLGLAPEEVEPGEVRRLLERFSEPDVESRVRREQDFYERDPARRLRIDDIPRFAYQSPGLLQRLRGRATEAICLLALNAIAAALVASRFKRWAPG